MRAPLLLVCALAGCSARSYAVSPAGLSFDWVTPVVLDAEGAPIAVEAPFQIEDGAVEAPIRLELSIDAKGERLLLVGARFDELAQSIPDLDRARADLLRLTLEAPPEGRQPTDGGVEAPIGSSLDLLVLEDGSRFRPVTAAERPPIEAGLTLTFPVDPDLCFGGPQQLVPFGSAPTVIEFPNEDVSRGVGVVRLDDDALLFVTPRRGHVVTRDPATHATRHEEYSFLFDQPLMVGTLLPGSGATGAKAERRDGQVRALVTTEHYYALPSGETGAQGILKQVARTPTEFRQDDVFVTPQLIFDGAFEPDGRRFGGGEGGLALFETPGAVGKTFDGWGDVVAAARSNAPASPHVLLPSNGNVYLGDVRSTEPLRPLPIDLPPPANPRALAVSADADPEIWAFMYPSAVTRRRAGEAGLSRVRLELPKGFNACAIAQTNEALEYRGAVFAGDSLWVRTTCDALLRIRRSDGCTALVPIAGRPVEIGDQILGLDYDGKRITTSGAHGVVYEITVP